MIVYAAIDIRGGRVVQLVGGDTEDVRIDLEDPVGVARGWIDAGFSALHVVDLDAAMSTGDNRDVIERMIDTSTVPVQVGGGIRTDDDVERMLDAGAASVVIGTRAVQDPKWLMEVAGRHAYRIVAAADVRSGFVATHGWRQTTSTPIDAFIGGLGVMPLGGVLVTDIDREGRMAGANTGLFGRLARATQLPILASGGIAGPEDLPGLADAGVAGVVLGMALYTGAFRSSIMPGSLE